KGLRKLMDSRPPVLPCCNSDSGSANFALNSFRAKSMNFSYCIDSTRKGSPPPTPDQALNKALHSAEENSETENTHGLEPNLADLDKPPEEIPTETGFVCPSQDEHISTKPPAPEAIRFFLPNVDDESEENDYEENEDDLNTERLLQQAENFMQKKLQEEHRILHSLVDANATILNDKEPNKSYINVSEGLKSSDSSSRDCPISSVAAQNRCYAFSISKMNCIDVCLNSSESNNINNNAQKLPSPLVTWSDSHTICQFEAHYPIEDKYSSIKFGKNTENFDCDSKECFVFPPGKMARSEIKNEYESCSRVETIKNYNKNLTKNVASFIMPNDTPIAYKPLEVDKSTNIRSTFTSKMRSNSWKSDSGKSKHKEELLAAAYASCMNGPNQTPMISCLSQESFSNQRGSVSAGLEPSQKLIATVTLAYDEDDKKSEGLEQVDKHSGKKIPKKKKTFDEIETSMSRLDKKELEGSKGKCACGDVACSEVRASKDHLETVHTSTSAYRPGLGFLAMEKNSFIKTTKTIELCEGAHPAETVTKNFLVASQRGKQQKPESRKITLVASRESLKEKQEIQRSETRTVFRPSSIKRQQASENKVKVKQVGTMKNTEENNHRIKPESSRDFICATVDSTTHQCEGGLAPPQSVHTNHSNEKRSEAELYESLLEEAKVMALTSMMEAAKLPMPGKKKAVTRPKPAASTVTTPKETAVSRPKPRPFSAPLKIASSKSRATAATATTAFGSPTGGKYKHCQGHPSKSKTSNQNGMRKAQSARPVNLLSGLDILENQEDGSPEMCHAQRMQKKMAAMGVEVDVGTLERALFPPSGKSLHYNVPGDLPRNPTEV
ncbi:hypothetical protein PoB_004147900, partial [Plakobranchus ocellatus]